jgi:hypothetical protein
MDTKQIINQKSGEGFIVASHTCYVAAEVACGLAGSRTRGKVPVATCNAPDVICGEAHRIGYAGLEHNALPVYRIKIVDVRKRHRVALPNMFVLEQGQFHDYDKWLQHIK